MRENLTALFVKLQVWFWRLSDKLLNLWHEADQRAAVKLGFISTPLFAPLLGAGIPAYVASRLLILAVLGGSTWWVIDNHNDKVRAKRDKVWEAKLALQMKEATAARKKIADQAEADIGKVEKAWRAYAEASGKHTADLTAQLEQQKTMGATCAIPPKAVKSLQNKARGISRALK